MIMSKYIIFYNYIYIRCCRGKALLYNLLEGSRILVEDPKLASKISKVHNKPYYGFKISKSLLGNHLFISFLNEVKEKMFGEIIEKSTEYLPLVFQPVVDVKGYSLDDDRISSNLNSNQQDFEYFKHRMGTDIINNLYEITLHINSASEIYKHRFAYKQYCYPFYSKSVTLDLEWAKRELSVFFPDLEVVNLVIGEVNDGNLSDLLEFIFYQSRFYKLNIYMFAHHFYQYRTDFIRQDNIQYILWLQSEEELLLSYTTNVILSILVENESEYRSCNKMSNIENNTMLILPYCNKNNRDFCCRLLSYTVKDLFSVKLKHNEIVSKSILNVNTFGSLVILPNGDIFSDINCRKLAVVNPDISLKEVIFLELVNSRNWFLTRKKVSPCRKCVFMNICPSITDMEHFMNKYDFCDIYKT